MNSHDTIKHYLDIQNLGAKGIEVVLSVVNEEEEWLYLRGAQVEVFKDEKSFGIYKVAFFNDITDGVVRLGQFEIAKGHFHIPEELEHKVINFRVFLDYKIGDTRNETLKISRRIETQRISKPKNLSQ